MLYLFNMKVAFDEQQQPGVFIALDEWPQIKDHIAELYQFMAKLSAKTVFEMSPAELQDHLLPAAEQAISRARANGMPFTYLNTNKDIDAQYVNEYPDGLDYLNVDNHTGKDITVKRFR